MRIAVIIALVLFISACATWNPTIGMTFDEFRTHWTYSSNYDPLRLVGDDGSTRVYESGDVFYYFVAGRLNRIDQGQLFEQRIRVTVE
jgi:hypothetical protein